jgi:hypothetical protein
LSRAQSLAQTVVHERYSDTGSGYSITSVFKLYDNMTCEAQDSMSEAVIGRSTA